MKLRQFPQNSLHHQSSHLISFFHSKTKARIAVTIGVTEIIKLADPAFTVFRRSLMRCDK